jgi:hypothetical protein
MKKTIKIIGLLLLTITISSCNDHLKEHLNLKYPPISKEVQQKRAIDSFIAAINNMKDPSITLGLNIKELEKRLSFKTKNRLDIEEIKLSSADQLMSIKVKTKKTFTKKDWENEDLINSVLKDSVVSTELYLNFDVTIDAMLESSDNTDNSLKLTLLPVFNSIEVIDADIENSEIKKEHIDVVGNAIEFLFNRYSENITSYLSSLKIMETLIPLNIVNIDDPEKQILSSTSDSVLNVNFKSKIQPINLRISNQAILLDDDFIHIIIGVVPSGVEKSTINNPLVKNYDEAKQAFVALHEASFDVVRPDSSIWVGVRKDLISLTLNNAISNSNVCLSSDTALPEETFSEKISPPTWETIKCNTDRECKQTRNCNIHKNQDTRNCKKCLIKQPRVCLPNTPFGKGSCSGGGCALYGNDPKCEVAKVAQNAIYDADHAGKVLDCERIKTQNRLTCEAEKVVEKGLCETGKEVIKRIAKTGNIANIKGNVKAYPKVKVCLENIRTNNELSNIKMNLALSGDVKLKGKMKLTPLDIIGHLTCQMPTESNLDFIANLPETQQELSINLKFEEVDGNFGLSFVTNELHVPVRLNPTPTEWFLTNADMTMKCMGLNLLKPLVITATPFIPELKGMHEHIQEPIHSFIKINLPIQKIGNINIESEINMNDKTVFVIAK